MEDLAKENVAFVKNVHSLYIILSYVKTSLLVKQENNCCLIHSVYLCVIYCSVKNYLHDNYNVIEIILAFIL